MKVIVTKSFDESCKITAELIMDQVRANPASKIGLATGGSAEPVYPYMIDAIKKGEVDFSQVKTVNLDEYVGMDPANEQSYRYYMNSRFFIPAGIDLDRTYVPSGKNDPEKEIELFKEKLYGDGHLVDLQLLGVGVSGHIGFNEPGKLISGPHIQELDESTIKANSRYFDNEDEVPTRAFTMGIGDIMKAAKVVLIATGDSKAAALSRLLMDDEITADVPVTVLKMHRDATIVIDEALAAKIGWKN